MAVIICSQAFAATERDLNADSYFAARIAEFEDRDADALANYSKLFKAEPASSALAERLYQNAILQGDMPSAVRAVRALELQNETDATAPLLLFADAFKRRAWRDAEIALLELEAKSNFGFIAPVFRAWINVAQGKPHSFDKLAARSNPLLNYYSEDQLVYLELATGNISAAKSLQNNFRNIENDFARDLIIRTAPILAANGQSDFARNMLSGSVDPEFTDGLLATGKNSQSRLSPNEGVATIFTRFAAALIEQNAFEQALTMARIANWLDSKSTPAQLVLSKTLYAMDRNNAGYELLNNISPFLLKLLVAEYLLAAAVFQ